MNTVALVGKANVGKSTLFNRLCGRREALVHDKPGLTRDRRYGHLQNAPIDALIVDTGGVGESSPIAKLIDEQVTFAVAEAELVLFLVDAKTGLSNAEYELANQLRKTARQVVLVLNKIDVLSDAGLPMELNRFGLGEPIEISAHSGRGVPMLIDTIVASLPQDQREESEVEKIKVALVGRSNVGKSTLLNTIVGSNRCIVYDEIGTTRDAIDVDVQRDEAHYVFIDTAGIRRRGRVDDVLEKFSIISAFKAMDRAQVALLLVDATEGIVDQDLHILQYAIDSGTGMVLVANKWDCATAYQRDQFKTRLQTKLRVADWVSVRYISALQGTGVNSLFQVINQIHKAGEFLVSTSVLNQALRTAVDSHAPPSVRGRQVKLRYAHKIGTHPPAILVHGNQTDQIPTQYTRYLENSLRNELKLQGVPIVIKFKSSDNPFKGRKNVLTPRQRRRRERLIQHRITR